jgi:hypothetical protein
VEYSLIHFRPWDENESLEKDILYHITTEFYATFIYGIHVKTWDENTPLGATALTIIANNHSNDCLQYSIYSGYKWNPYTEFGRQALDKINNDPNNRDVYAKFLNGRIYQKPKYQINLLL